MDILFPKVSDPTPLLLCTRGVPERPESVRDFYGLSSMVGPDVSPCTSVPPVYVRPG